MSSFRLDLELNGNVQSFTFSSPSVTIGRDPASDVFLDHATVSRQHALIVQNPHGFTLVVLSQNGLTGVNGNKVNGSVDLQNGMRLQFGQFLANFQTDSGHATMPFEPIRGGGPLLTDHPTQPNAQFGAGPVVVGNAPTGVLQNAPTAAIPAIGGAMGGFGAPLQPSQGGFAPGPSAQGFQAAPQQPPFGAQAVTSPPSGMHQTGAISNPQTSHGIVSWDEIAKQATTDDPHEKVETHFERMKAASDKNKQGTHPAILLLVVILAVGGTWWYVSGGGGGDIDAEIDDKKPKPEMYYLADDFDCLKPDGCLADANAKYKIGIENLKKKQADVGNLFRGYMNLDMADRYVQASGKPLPAEMSDLAEKREEALQELKSIEQNYQVQYHRSFQRRQFEDMVSAIQAMRARFPDPRSRVYRDAEAKEMFMKENAILPKKKK